MKGRINKISPYGLGFEEQPNKWYNAAVNLAQLHADIHQKKDEWIGKTVELTLNEKGKYVSIKEIGALGEQIPQGKVLVQQRAEAEAVKNNQIRRLSLIKSTVQLVAETPITENIQNTEEMQEVADRVISLARYFETYVTEDQ